MLITAWPSARGFPANDRELDSAVEGVQKYLESSGFPKMTRGEVLDFLNDFSRNARVSRSEGGGKRDASAQQPAKSETVQSTLPDAPKIPPGESPLNYGYPLSSVAATKRPVPAVSSPASRDRGDDKDGEKNAEAIARAIGARGGPKKSVGPPVDLNAYAKFKKIPEGKNLKIDDDMKTLLGGFGLLDGAAAKAEKNNKTEKTTETLRRSDDGASATETVDAALLKSVLIETGSAGANETAANLSHVLLHESASNTRDHVFNPSDPDVRTVDVNRIAKIVENIRLLADDNDTVSLSQEAIQKKLENITAAIAAIDRPPATSTVAAAAGQDKPFDGYEVFFDDDSKEVDSDLPDSPTGGGVVSAGPDVDVLAQLPLNQALNPPDPLSTDELQHLLEKNKHDVKRQEPASDATLTTSAATTTSTETSAETSTAIDTSTTSDSSSDATSVEVTSDASSAARDSSTAAAEDASPSLSQLAESFGGGETASSPPPSAVDAPATPDRPRSGLYFYVDWNSFLTVNEGQKNQVNLRFAPKAGNAAHFIKVNVP